MLSTAHREKTSPLQRTFPTDKARTAWIPSHSVPTRSCSGCPVQIVVCRPCSDPDRGSSWGLRSVVSVCHCYARIDPVSRVSSTDQSCRCEWTEKQSTFHHRSKLHNTRRQAHSSRE